MHWPLFKNLYLQLYLTWRPSIFCWNKNRESELSAWGTRNWSRVLLYLQSIEGMWIIMFNISESKILLCRFWPYHDQLTNIVLLDFQFRRVKFHSKNYLQCMNNGYFHCCFIRDVIAMSVRIQFVWNTLECPRPILEGNLVIVLVY